MTYNIRDVEAEMQIQDRLKKFTVHRIRCGMNNTLTRRSISVCLFLSSHQVYFTTHRLLEDVVMKDVYIG